MSKLWLVDVKGTVIKGSGYDEERETVIDPMLINPDHIKDVFIRSNTIRMIDGTQHTLTDFSMKYFMELNDNVS